MENLINLSANISSLSPEQLEEFASAVSLASGNLVIYNEDDLLEFKSEQDKLLYFALQSLYTDLVVMMKEFR